MGLYVYDEDGKFYIYINMLEDFSVMWIKLKDWLEIYIYYFGEYFLFMLRLFIVV